MNVMLNLLVAVQILSALVMIGLVLIQHGKGADMGASFGSGASGSLFGATGSANFLSRSTAVCAAVFFVATLGLAYTAFDRSGPSTGSVLDRPSSSAAPASGPAVGAAQIPAAASAPAASSSAAPASQTTPAAAVPAVAPSASGAGAVPTQ